MDADEGALTKAWLAAQDGMPDGWQLDGLRCASTGLSPDERSDDWIAAATGADGVQRTFRAADPFEALTGLTDLLSRGP